MGDFHGVADKHTITGTGAVYQEGIKVRKGIDGVEAFYAKRLLGTFCCDGIAEYNTKIRAVSYMAGIYCYWAVCGHAGANGKIYT